jgi:hypothetical protein
MRSFYNNYIVNTNVNDYYPNQRRIPKLKFYPSFLTTFALFSVAYILKPIYTEVWDWPSIR